MHFRLLETTYLEWAVNEESLKSTLGTPFIVMHVGLIPLEKLKLLLCV